MSDTNVAEAPAPASGSRLAYLDNIRILLITCVILHHCAITYGADGGWYRHEVAYDALGPVAKLVFSLFTSVDQAFSMGFFFLLAGYFTAPSLARKGSGHFMGERLVRLGIPLAAFALLLSPLTIGIARLGETGGTLYDGFHWVYAMGHYECGPLWFAQALLLFSFLYVLLSGLVGKIATRPAAPPPFPSNAVLLGAAVATGLIAFALRFDFPVGRSFSGMNIGYFASYAVLFFAGCRAARGRWLEKVPPRSALIWALITLAAIAANPLLSGLFSGCGPASGGWNAMAFCYAMWEPFVAWGLILGLLWGFRKFLNRAGPLARHLARSSFTVYIVHAPVLVTVSMLARGWAADPLCKWIVVGALSCIGSWLLASILVRLPGFRRVL